MVHPEDESDQLGVTDELTIYRRYLPHWEAGGSTYFLTFRLYGTHPKAEQGSSGVGSSRAGGERQPAFAPQERDIIMSEILFWHTKRWFVHALTVMPDHVHILAQPLEKSPGVWFALLQILHSIKRKTAWDINRLRGRRGTLWQSERKDRAVRDEFEFDQKARYILENAQKRGLVGNGWEYQWFWCPGKEELQRRMGRR